MRRHKGSVGDVHLKDAVLTFRRYCTVRADCFCPSGSRGYFELEILSEGDATQWGFCTESFLRVDEYIGAGVGDDEDSWGVDGYRGMLWHSGEAGEYQPAWKVGDVIGLACNLVKQDSEESSCFIQVSVNGRFEDDSIVFKLPSNLQGLYPAVTSMAGSVRIRLGGLLMPLLYKPPNEMFLPMATFARENQ